MVLRYHGEMGIRNTVRQYVCFFSATATTEIYTLSLHDALPLSSHRRVLGSWDRFILALPFSRGVYVWGAPIAVSRREAGDATQQRLEERLNAVTAEADRLVGVSAIEPAPIEAPPIEAPPIETAS